MPSPYVIKTYTPNTYHHVFNRGVNKQLIFQDDLDYRVFLNLLRTALQHPTGVIRRKNFANEIQLVAYCLMPNHFHLLVRQVSERALASFMRSVMNAYSRYYNQKYSRTGKLCEGTFKAKLIKNDAQLVETSRYIHRNPARLTSILDYAYSSFSFYMQDGVAPWLDFDPIFQQFANVQEYSDFVLRGDTS